MITKTELAICANLGVSLSTYVIRRRARTLGQNILSINVAGAVVSGGRGRQVVDEASERLRGSGALDKTTGPGALLAEAAELCDAAYAAYRDNPDSDAAWQRAAEAGAYLEEALERFAPAYANRMAGGLGTVPDNAAVEPDDAESRGPRNPFGARHAAVLRDRVGAAIARIADPMLRAAGAEGLGSVAMPLRLNAAELAICNKFGRDPQEFAAALARRRMG